MKKFGDFFTDIAILHVWMTVDWNSNSKKNGKVMANQKGAMWSSHFSHIKVFVNT